MNKCSFCGRREDQVELLIYGAEGFICDECIEQANAIIKESKTNKSKDLMLKDLPKPKEIKE